MKARFALQLALPFSAVLAGCTQPAQPATASARAEAPETAPAALPVLQWQGQTGGEAVFATRVLKDPAEWAAAWKQVGRDMPRPLDPAKEMGVAVYMGERRTGGYKVQVEATYPGKASYIVVYEMTVPAADAVVMQMITQPWVIAVMPRSELPVVFIKPSGK